MKTVQIKGMDVELYNSIEDLPIMRFHKYNKMLLIDAGIGSDLADFDRHMICSKHDAKFGNSRVAKFTPKRIFHTIGGFPPIFGVCCFG